MASVSLKHIYKKYPGGVTAVSDFNLEIKDKEFLVLVGPSGCGKSTTLRMIAGLEEISEGELRIGDRLVNDVAPKDRKIAMVFQNYALYPHMSVFENMAFGLKLSKVPKEVIKKKVEEAARIMDITHLLDRKPKALSGGQKQRVALGRAIVRDPQVFLLDEPLSNLDAKLRATMRTELTKLHNRVGTTFIYVTHDQVEAMTMATRIVVMKDGIVQQIGKPQNVYDDPVNLFVAKFLGTPPINVFSGEVKNEQLYIGSEAVLSTPGVSDQPVHVGIRPEGFILKEDGPLSCDLVRLEVMGRDVSIVSTHEQSQNVTIRSIIDADEGKSLPTGKVHFGLKPAKVFLFCTDTEERIRF